MVVAARSFLSWLLHGILICDLYRKLITYIVFLLPVLTVAGQEIPDSLRNSGRSLDDTTGFYLLLRDTVRTPDMLPADSLVNSPAEEVILEAPIDYTAKDSIIFSLDGQRVFMYGEAKVKYMSVELNAYHIILDLETKEVYAEGIPDSLGVLTGKPVFQDGSEKFESKTLRYNFQTQKGIITDVVTEQGEGFVHSARAKKISKDAFLLQQGKYTTCDADHPHFYLNLSRAKIISNNKIITGPAYMVLEDFPLYFPVIPFGYFPSSPTYSSGILIPSYGEEANRGFYLREGGYYWAANDFFDLAVRGDIYSKGSWAAKLHTNYKVRYRFSGSFDFRYAVNVYGERGLDTYKRSPQFQVVWSHAQDAKANPSRNFSANVNFSTSGYDKQNALADGNYTSENYLRTQKSSSISYSKRWENTPFSMSANFRHSQNSTDTTLTLSLPELTFNMAKIYPFKVKNRVGSAKWYEKFGFNYSANMRNTITAKEYEILQKSLTTDWKNGIQHNLPISLPNFNLFKYINMSPSVSYNERWYFQSIEKTYYADQTFRDERGRVTHVKTDTITGLKRNYQYAYSLSATTNLYGMYLPLNPNSRIQGIRHKITPQLSFSYNPDFGDPKYGFWKTVQLDSTGRMEPYSVFEGGIYGATGRGAAGMVSFNLSNNLEMKVLETKDTTATSKYKKVKLIDNFSINTSYNLVADSFNLSPVSIRGRTTIQGVGVNFGTMLDPYMTNNRGQRINQYAWNHNKGLAKLGRFTNANLSFGMQFDSKKGQKDKPAEGEEEQEDAFIPENIREYMDFSIPWSVGFDYSFTYLKPNPNDKARITQTISLRGKITLTDKWSINMNTNYDISARAFSFTNFSVFRDLHCWEMSLNFVPFGYMKSYSFTLNARTSMLRDLKVSKQRSFYDNL